MGLVLINLHFSLQCLRDNCYSFFLLDFLCSVILRLMDFVCSVILRLMDFVCSVILRLMDFVCSVILRLMDFVCSVILRLLDFVCSVILRLMDCVCSVILRLMDFDYSFGTIMILEEKFEYSKVVISGRKSTKNRECNGQKNNKDK